VTAERRRDAEIRDDNPGTDVAREDVHPGAASREVLDHLRGHGLGVGAHALGRDAVVAGEREDHRRIHARQGIPGDHDHPDGELLQPPQAPPGLRQAVEPATSRLGQPLVRHDDGGDEAIQGDHWSRSPSGDA
jgi:hypothetical protein